MKKYDKDYILEQTDEGLEVYKAYLSLKQKDAGTFENTLNPCYRDKNPSLSIYYDSNQERWRYHDHGNSPDGIDYSGDCFDFVAQVHNLNVKSEFAKICEIISKDTGVELRVEFEIIDDTFFNVYGYELVYKDSQEFFEYFSQYGITSSLLVEYNVKCIAGYKLKGSERVSIHKSEELLIGFEDQTFVKLYKPSPKSFRYLGKKDKNYVFGFKEIFRRAWKTKKAFDGTIFITGGEKDVLTLTSLGYDAICLNSETADIPKSIIDFLQCFKNVVILYDCDSTGSAQASKLEKKYRSVLKIRKYCLPEILTQNGGKDISDFVKLKMDTEYLKADIDSFLNSKQVDLQICDDKISDSDNEVDRELSNKGLDDSIFEKLPSLLKRVTDEFSDKTDKDLILLSSLGVISSLLPTVGGRYSGSRIGCNLYLFISAPAASGKSAINWARKLGVKVDNMLEERYLKEYQQFTLEMRDQKINRGNESRIDILTPPKAKNLFIPGNISVSKMIELLEANERFGVLFETEADTLTGALSSEWGDFSSVLRCAFHHEAVAKARMTDIKRVRAENPHLSVVLTGTPEQLRRLIGDVENGFFSRFVFYDFKGSVEWVNQFLPKDNRREETFDQLGKELGEIWRIHEQHSGTIIELTPSQVSRFSNFFDRQLKIQLEEYGDDIVANIKRIGIVAYRLMMIFTALRSLENKKMLPEVLEVADGDFDMSLSIVSTMLKNLESVFCSLQRKILTGKLNNQQSLLYEKLSDDFSKNEFLDVIDEIGMNVKTGEKYLKDYVKMKIMHRVKHGYYQKAA